MFESRILVEPQNRPSCHPSLILTRVVSGIDHEFCLYVELNAIRYRYPVAGCVSFSRTASAKDMEEYSYRLLA
jgi:hypothetical protein